MRLKNIKLAGFKSFVDPTNVQLSTNMVAVIGPNGCGKSNIIDAVRWVMGESSAKNLRGESMTDVIFNGSTSRKPVGQASIELIFDNSDGTLVGQYGAFTEIAIKRKVTRDGQSGYYINGAKCRRRDITDIFLGTGLGPRSYAIIEQGMISRLIESKPEELRVFIEEAAGISKYKERRRETETRIRHTRENLERLTDIREELDRQLQRLKRQAAAAVKYKEFKAEERTVKAQTLSLQWKSLRERSSGQREAIAEHEIQLEASIASQLATGASIETIRDEQVSSNDTFNTIQAKYYGLGADIARAEQSIAHHEQRAQQLADDLRETQSTASESAQHLAEDQEKMTTWSLELETIEPRHEALRESESASSDALQSAENNMQDWQQRWDSFNENAAEPQKNAEVQRSRIDQIEDALRGLSIRLERMNTELGGLDTQEHEEQQTELAMSIEDQIARVETLQEQVLACNAELQDKRDAQKQYSSELNTVRSTLQQQRGRYASLEALQQAAQADATGDTDAWLQTQQLSTAPRLLDQLKVDGGWEVAVETVLGDSLQAVTLDTLDDIIGNLSTIGKSNVSFIELGNQPAGAQSNTGLSLLSSKVAGVETGALLHGVFVAETLEQAASARGSLTSHESIVTKDGIWLGPNWLRVIKQTDSGSGVIERRKSLLSLEQEISDSEASIDNLENALKESENALLAAENNKDRLLNDKTTEEQSLAQHRSNMSALTAKIDQIKTRFSRTQEEIRLAEQNQVQQREALTEAREQLDIAIESMQEVEELRESLLLERDKVRDALTISRETARTDRDALQAVAVRAEGLRAQLDSVRGTVSRLSGQVEQLELRSASLLQSQEENNAPIAELKSSLAEQLETRVAIEESLSEARKSVEALDHSMREAEQARANGEQKTQDIRSRLEKLRIDSQEMAVRTKTIEEQLEESGFKLEAVLNLLPEEAELSVWQTTLEDIDRRINRLGAINLAAIEEFETESERKNYLDAQNDELESALTTLEGAIHKIDKETRSLFKDTFDKLNASLQDLFPKVFGGGTAYLEMTGDDLLDTGIAIMARPPGKRNSTIHLLSGGEKALTAIALVFSIFQLNPAPFCMLDEVDAPLDDANTTRYARLIKEMSDRVQFIFITHNKITMEMADHLMGVTMHEPGCSRLVSVDIDEAVALATA